jgi:dTMP kinase
MENKTSLKLKNPILIAIEGIDGTGKTTQARLLYEYLREQDLPCLLLKEPTDGVWGQKIKQLSKHGRTSSPHEEMMLFLKDRKEDVENNILPAMQKNYIVIMDRYYISSMAYQGALPGMNSEEIKRLNEEIAPKPDLVIIIDVPPTISLARIRNFRKEETNYFEREEYLEKVRTIFHSLRTNSNVHFLDGTTSVTTVRENIINIINDLVRANSVVIRSDETNKILREESVS